MSWLGSQKKLTLILNYYHFFKIFLSDLKSLQGTSSIANFSNIVAFLVAFYFDLEHYHLASNEHRREFSISEFPFFFSIAIYCFEVRLIFKIWIKFVDKSEIWIIKNMPELQCLLLMLSWMQRDKKKSSCRKYIFSKKNFVVSFSSIFRRRQQKHKLAQFTFLY